jgi:hypothetical protein
MNYSIETMEGSVMNVGMMQSEKKKERIYSKENTTGSARSGYIAEISRDKW